MSHFEYLFAFYGLLLGLALANVASGFADLWRRRERIKPGILVPILGLLVLTAVMSNWYTAWASREGLEVTPSFLFASVCVALPLIFVGQAMFPENPDAWQSLDEYYIANRAILPTVTLLSPLASIVFGIAHFGQSFILGDWIRILLVVTSLAILPFSSRKWLHAVTFVILAFGYAMRMMYAYWYL